MPINTTPLESRRHAGREHAFPVLDGLRGVAAISIAIFHYVGSIYDKEEFWLPNAFLAVDFFFVLSGFVIAHAYEKRIMAGQTAGEFMLRRLIRLYPLYWLGLAVSALVVTVAQSALPPHSDFQLPPLVSYVFSIFFLPTPPSLLDGEKNIFPLGGPLWSLSLEIAVNLVYALICRHLTTPRLAVLAFAGGLGLIAAIRIYGTVPMGWDWPTYPGGWARAIWSFFAGVLLYLFFHSEKRTLLPAWAAAIPVLAVIAVFAYRRMDPVSESLICIILFPMLVWIGAKTSPWTPMRGIYAWLGRTSYALYVIHAPLIPCFFFALKHINVAPDAHAPFTATVWIGATLAVAWILDVAYDAPVRAFLGRKLLPALHARRRQRAK